MKTVCLALFHLLLASALSEHAAPCPGCPYEADVNSSEIRDLLNSSLAQTNSNFKDVNIKNCTQQVVAGKKYHCQLEVTGDSNDVQTCEIEFVHQPWISPEPKVIRETCSNVRTKREVCAGCPVNQDVNDEGIKGIVQNAMDSMNLDLTSVHPTNCTSQVVSGVKYSCTVEITSPSINGPQTCHIEVLSQPWISKNPQILSEDCSKLLERTKRSLGSYKPVVGKNDIVEELAKQGAERVSLMVNSPFVKRLKSILRVEEQIVSGINYAMTLELADTDCLKSTVQPNSVCNFASEPIETLVCSMIIYDAPHKNERTISINECHNIKSSSKEVSMVKRSLLGGVEDLPVDTPEFQELLDFVGTEATARTNSNSQLKVVKTLSAKQQIVSGRKVMLKVLLASCSSQTDSANDCAPGEAEKVCEVSIWEQPWLNKREITNFRCENDGIREVRMLGDIALERLSTVLGVRPDNVELLQFAAFLSAYEPQYMSLDEPIRYRFRVFKANLLKIRYLQRTEQATGVYGMTQFADLTRSEFKKKYLGLKEIPADRPFPSPNTAPVPNVTLPLSFDWRDYGAVTPVKNQRQCGSCWAFSVTGNIEGVYAVKNHKLVSLSEQELVDCDTLDDGCEGGLFWSAFESVQKLGGLETETEYPYVGVDETCQMNKSAPVVVNIRKAVNVSNDEDDMAKYLVSHGPISVALNANAMQFYFGGVSHPFKFLCNPKSLDHGVLLVGYGVHRTSILHKTLPYWVIKNSWGESWGKQGYYWLYRGDGSCGVNQTPSSAVL